MKDLRISDMMQMQLKLWECNREKWSPFEPQYGRESLLWMIEEVGEIISIIKKKEESDIMDDHEVRNKFVEEFADVFMYLTDTMMRYGITPDEISTAYVEKHIKNLGRNYSEEYATYLTSMKGAADDPFQEGQ